MNTSVTNRLCDEFTYLHFIGAFKKLRSEFFSVSYSNQIIKFVQFKNK